MLRTPGNVLIGTSAQSEELRRRRGAVFDTVDEQLNANRVTLYGAVEGEIFTKQRANERQIYHAEESLFLSRTASSVYYAYGLCLLTLDKYFNYLPEAKRFPVGAP